MIQTTKKHWVNGFSVRGCEFKSFNLALFGYGIGFYWGSVLGNKVPLYFETYHLN